MTRAPILEEVEASYKKTKVPAFNVGDVVRVQTRIREGDKERTQAFMGTVVAKKGTGISETFTLYRTAYGSSMDRVFMLHSPGIASLEVVRAGKVRKSKLYYLRGRSGKKSKIRELFNAEAQEQSEPEAPTSTEG